MKQKSDICRAITFINYHIPLMPELDHEDWEEQYSTVGFFDGMITERLDIRYGEDGLKELWKYGLKRTEKSKGHYSYQNTFCFSKDDWNEGCTDAEFWHEDTNKKFPLTFVVFLQLREYMQGKEAISSQCRLFNRIIQENLQEGCSYSYSTVDKNDFVICIKCRQYKNAVATIKKLHETGKQVVYSYTVFSVANKVLGELSDGNYQDVCQTKIKSICLKGITNSFDPEQKIRLDRKYYEFCTKFVEKLFDKTLDEIEKEKYDYKLYDILGDNDFRLIVRDVKLGNILRQFASGGMLCYWEKVFQSYLFSSRLVLNTETDGGFAKIEEAYIEKNYLCMKENFVYPECQRLQDTMVKISEVVAEHSDWMDEKMVTCCQAIWQLLQSLKALEMAPTKKYDFWSLYHPLSLLVHILESKMRMVSGRGETVKKCKIFDVEEVYDFIHKISMTFHGTLRTDIQFFQVRDFNVTVHYAPAKLRAFYSLWTLEVSRYYNEFCDPEHRNSYSFIFSPGMFRWTGVKQLLMHYKETERLMLITTPERHLYLPKWLLVIIAHEVSHFVGYETRKREARHNSWVEICARILALEMYRFQYDGYPNRYKNEIERGIEGDNRLPETLMSRLYEEVEIIRKEKKLYPHEFHSENSFIIIEESFKNLGWNNLEKIVTEYCEMTNNFLKEKKNINNMRMTQKNEELYNIRYLSNAMNRQLQELFCLYQQNALHSILEVIRNVTSESYADLMAILTLDLRPEEYVKSFVKSGMGLNGITENELDEGLLLFVRIGVTIKTLCDVVRKEREWFLRHDPEFYNIWSQDVIKILPHKLINGSVESNIAVKVYGYVSSIRDISKCIRNYEKLFDVEKEEFAADKFDFFNDAYIIEAMCGYLEECVQTYIGHVSSNSELEKQKKALLSTYVMVSGDSASEMMQAVEDYLADYEKKVVRS